MAFTINTPFRIRLDYITHAVQDKVYKGNIFQRGHTSIEEYSSFLDDTDDILLHKTTNWERMKHFTPKKENTVADTPAIPETDNDDAFKFFDVNGESLYTNPPDPNFPTVDHGVGEEKIWSFRSTAYNQSVIPNINLELGLRGANRQTNVPFWGEKLMAPHFYKDDKMVKFFRHWKIREDFEILKVHQAAEELATKGQDQTAMRARHQDQVE